MILSYIPVGEAVAKPSADISFLESKHHYAVFGTNVSDTPFMQ
jgi:hypothetical protein